MEQSQLVKNKSLSKELNRIKNTINCPYNFSCLSTINDQLFPQCEPKCPLNEKYFFINLQGPKICSFRNNIQSATACNCPLRIQLYNHYQI